MGVCTACSVLLDYCQTCSGTAAGTCSACISTAYWVNAGNCELCDPHLAHCIRCSPTGDACTQCLPAYYVDPADSTMCTTCNVSPTLANCVECTSDTVCTKCVTGTHFLDAATCHLCSTTLTDCVICDDNATCTQCDTNAYLSGAACVKCNLIHGECL